MLEYLLSTRVEWRSELVLIDEKWHYLALVVIADRLFRSEDGDAFGSDSYDDLEFENVQGVGIADGFIVIRTGQGIYRCDGQAGNFYPCQLSSLAFAPE
jgi:hypothetical protein